MPLFLIFGSMNIQSEVLDNPHLIHPLLVLGAGHFGQRAVTLLSKRVKGKVWVIDKDWQSLEQVTEPNVERVQTDAVEFLLSKAKSLPEETHIVPAVPFHLAYEFAKRTVRRTLATRSLPVPLDLKKALPYVWEGADGSFLVSYANFRCPDNCPEPLYCTVTGEKRDKPLFTLLRELRADGFRVYIIRSRQMAPGVGGYDLADLLRLCFALERGPGKWLVGTACKCHGVLSGLEIVERATR